MILELRVYIYVKRGFDIRVPEDRLRRSERPAQQGRVCMPKARLGNERQAQVAHADRSTRGGEFLKLRNPPNVYLETLLSHTCALHH